MRHMAQSYGEYRREGDIALGSRVVSQGLMETGESIRKRRQELRWSQEYFAEKAGISVNTVIRIEGGQSATSIEVFEKIAEALKTDVNTLLGKTAAVPPEEKQLYHMACRIRRLDKNGQNSSENYIGRRYWSGKSCRFKAFDGNRRTDKRT